MICALSCVGEQDASPDDSTKDDPTTSSETTTSNMGDTSADSNTDPSDTTNTEDSDIQKPNCDGHPNASDENGISVSDVESWTTFEHASIVAAFDGDENRNASAKLYRRTADDRWVESAWVLRSDAGSAAGKSWPSRLSASLFGLTSNQHVEALLHVSDPDGGCSIQEVGLRTRSPLQSLPGANILTVAPDTIAAALSSANPGDVLELTTGSYATLTLTRDGNAQTPIVLRAKQGNTPEIEGDIRLDGRSFIIVEGLRVRGQIKFNGAHDIAIRRCEIQTTGDGIVMFTRGENIQIADNVISGASAWNVEALGVDGENVGEGIVLTGPGHVIENNEVRGFRDAISLLEGDEAVDQFNIDILRNDISEAGDDGIEADFCAHNCRIVENRIRNAFVGISSQPSLGGPTYALRNVQYNIIYTAFKLHRESEGDVLLHNTVVKQGDAFAIYTDDTFDATIVLNNLFVGGPGNTWGEWSSGNGDVIQIPGAGEHLRLDYNGYAMEHDRWSGRIRDERFSTWDELLALGYEEHSIRFSRSEFEEPPAYPDAPFPALDAPFLIPGEVSSVLDRALEIPGINADYEGDGPDLGAYERGGRPLHFGPRI